VRGIIYFLFTAIIFALIGWFAHVAYTIPGNPIAPTPSPRPTPLSKYKIENLSLTSTESAEIVIDRQLKKTEDYTSSVFKMSYNPGLGGNSIKTVSGLINEPNSEGKFPAVLLFRGFVPKEKYFIGNGSAFISEYLVKNGFITIAPDFLGYGESDIEAENIFESRFQTYTTAITLLRNVKSFEKWDGENIFIWGHSNGGQITLTLLEATGIDYPSVLWAPVSKPFPYSVLYYTDEASDEGKFLRNNLAEFEKDYDPMLFSLTGYLDRINAPIQIHQGTNDEAVPLVWTSLLVKNLRSLNKEVEFITYPEANHNLTPGWNTAAENTLNFYRKFLVE
jgi:dipeptidyl aminopeptidase/acylaminoacyl peptidase